MAGSLSPRSARPCYKQFMTRPLFLSSIPLAAAAAFAAPATAQTGEVAIDSTEQARIPFADRTIRNWRTPSRDVVLIEAGGGQWYRADLMGSCSGLRFSETLGFETNAGGSFDRFSSIVTRDQNCPVRSLVAIPDPDVEAEATPDG